MLLCIKGEGSKGLDSEAECNLYIYRNVHVVLSVVFAPFLCVFLSAVCLQSFVFLLLPKGVSVWEFAVLSLDVL